MNDDSKPNPPDWRPTEAPQLYSQDGKGLDAIVHAHYFVGSNDWLITEYDPAEDLAFGWACLNGDRQNAELGYVSMAELEEIRVPFAITVDGGPGLQAAAVVERDAHWTPISIRQAVEELDRRQGILGRGLLR